MATELIRHSDLNAFQLICFPSNTLINRPEFF